MQIIGFFVHNLILVEFMHLSSIQKISGKTKEHDTSTRVQVKTLIFLPMLYKPNNQ